MPTRLWLACAALAASTACVGFKDGAATNDDSGPTSVPDDSGLPPGLSNIQALRQGVYSEGDTVTVEGVMLGPQTEIGFFVVEPAGGPWTGAWVYAPNDFQGLEQGTRVRVTGVYEEYSQEGSGSLTELNLEDSGAIEVLEGAGNLPAPTTLSVAQLSDPAQAEPYESTLVEVRDVRVTSTDLGYGEWELEGSIVVDDYYYAPANLTQGEVLARVAGALNFHYGAFKLEPRYPRDIER